jgi:hypothetical protein
MVSPGNHEFRLGQLRSDQIKGLNHELEAFVSSPFAESQNAMEGSSTPREIGEFRPARKYAMRAQVDVVSPILVVQDLAIGGHEYGDGIREQQHSRSHCTRQAI